MSRQAQESSCVTEAIADYESKLGIPATDALTRSPDRLVDMVVRAFPELKRKLLDVRQLGAEEVVSVGEREFLGKVRAVDAADPADQTAERRGISQLAD